MSIRGIRGATTIDHDDADLIVEATTELLVQMLEVNQIEVEDIASCWLTTTPDVTAQFPAVAARQMGWKDVALMCAHEMVVPGSLPLCIRAMIHWNTDKSQTEIEHVYLRDATQLRPDLQL